MKLWHVVCVLQCTYACGSWLLELATVTLSMSGFGPLQYDLSVLVSLQAASSHTQTDGWSTYR